MKRFWPAALLIFAALCALSGCGCDDGWNTDLVFINDSDTPIMTVWTVFETRVEEAGYADSSPLKRGETFGFEAGEFPVTVVVYEDYGQKELGRITIKSAPPDGERWYVAAQDGENGLTFTTDTRWPKGA